MAAWDGGVLLFLVLVVIWMARLSAAEICKKYIEEDEKKKAEEKEAIAKKEEDYGKEE